MLPELFKIPGLGWTVSSYGLLVAIAFILGLWLTAHFAARDGLPKNRVYDLGLYILVAALVGAKVLMVITEWNEFSDWRQILSFDILRSGGVYFGGFLVAVLVSIILMKKWHLPWRKTADAFAPGIAVGHSIGRLGCFAAGCCWGKPTTSWIGVKFTERASELTGVPVDVALVPTQLIEAVANLLIFLVLLWVRKRRAFDGQVIFAYMIIYSVARFTIEFWRDDPRGHVFGLSTSQLVAAALFPLGIALMIYYWRRSSSNRMTHRSDVAAQIS